MSDYDWIIVGAGSAGAVLADRLSQREGVSVLLLEAGPDNTSADTPATLSAPNFYGALTEPGRFWPNLQATLAEGREPELYLRGRGVGGSSAINGMLAMRGIPEDYDRWEEFGANGWGWNEMRDAFVAVEDDPQYGGDGLYGKGGGMPIDRQPADASPYNVAMRTAMGALGYRTDCDNVHAPGVTGLSRGGLTVREERRVSTNDAYLEPARGRANLTIVGDAVVDRIGLDGNRAVGVVTSDGRTFTGREIILSAGAIHSPAILLRSGIGTDGRLPVGKNLIDHAGIPMIITFTEQGREPRLDVPTARAILRYDSGLVDGLRPNDMHVLMGSPFGADETALSLGFMLPAVFEVFSRGEVSLNSTDSIVDPRVDFRMLSDERDLIRLRDGVRRMVEVWRHPAAAAIADNVLIGAVGMDDLDIDNDDAVDEMMMRDVTTYVHASGTCRMGSGPDGESVVDPIGRVHGYEGLRVCDASIMPDITRAPTHLTVVAIGERMSRLL